MSTLTCVLFIFSSPAAMSLCKAPPFSRPCESVDRQGFPSTFISYGWTKVFSSSFPPASVCLGDLAKSLILCLSGLVLGVWELDTATTLISWARWQVCSAAGSFLKVARPIHVLSVMSQQGAHAITFKHSSVSTLFARVTWHDIQNYTDLCLCCCHTGSWWSFWYWALLPALSPLFSAAECPACSRNS